MHQSWPARTSQDEDQSSGIWDREARQWAQKPDADSENDPLIVLMRQKGALAPEHSFLDVGCGPGRYSVVLAREAKFIFLGVKPAGMGQVLVELAPVLAQRTDRFVLVSMAAGLQLDRLAQMLGRPVPMLRIMPNTPVAIGQGMILYTAGPGVDREDLEEFLIKMDAAGRFDAIDEKLMDAGSSVSGCGPAYVYQFIEALADGGVECGLPRAKALEYAAQTLVGAAQMVLETGKHPGQLKDEVCSPGGSTIAGVHALEEGGLRAAAINAVVKSFEKNKELGKQ